ncbi:Predicted phosphotransferase related to Ser/Thr protein kinases [Legionella steigerwaltii]|uniref:Phosphotransferase enzyme family protein n=1 Tax=Legionella steigerwaltii TaxID=460 RepID=A0A378LCX0_9GAMM|nr:phosphotransferase [Legionella steigerwaltii]KTD79541.1 Phosphotransferase enzyme family protein [Legionella steigerwaltii]STY24574.1 Predicted phosphotransferase related to Ser/Thr protein kinases [Legionella steigerwaltii]
MNAENDPALLWAQNYLNQQGYSIQEPFKTMHSASWAKVYQIATTKGFFYLKQIPKAFAIEPNLLLYLRSFFPALVPEVLGTNPDLHCFLMSDRGTPLGESLAINYQIELAREALKSYVTIQTGLISQIDSLLALGVPDWRLANLPDLYLNLLDESDFLKDEGLSTHELQQLISLHPRFVTLCQQLAQYAIPETIEHSDFHENNILHQVQHLTLIDWGESVISHPFFSLISFLMGMMRNHQINEQNGIYGVLRDSYLSHWHAFESQERLLNAFALAKRLSPIKYCLSFYRLTQCPGWYAIERHQGRVAKVLRTFLQSEIKADKN